MLRHIIGLVVGLILAPILCFALGWGYVMSIRTTLAPSGLTGEVLLGTGILVLVGATAGAMAAMRRLSPLAPLIAGVFLVALSGVYLLFPIAMETLLPPGVGNYLDIRFFGSVLGPLLVVSALSPSRWRGSGQRDEPGPRRLQPPTGRQEWGASYPPPGGSPHPPPPGGFTEPSGPSWPPQPPGEGPRP